MGHESPLDLEYHIAEGEDGILEMKYTDIKTGFQHFLSLNTKPVSFEMVPDTKYGTSEVEMDFEKYQRLMEHLEYFKNRVSMTKSDFVEIRHNKG